MPSSISACSSRQPEPEEFSWSVIIAISQFKIKQLYIIIVHAIIDYQYTRSSSSSSMIIV